MSSFLFRIGGAVVISLAVAGLAFGQTQTTVTPPTATTTVQNPDGSWTVVEYPLDREVTVNLMPTATVPRATVRRTANGTTVIVDPSSVAGVRGNLNLYAVDATGRVTLLGPVTAGSAAPLTYTTPLDKFMLVLSPEANLTTIAPTTAVVYRSAVPTGLSIVPLTRSEEGPAAVRGAEMTALAVPSYNVPMLGIPSLPRNKETEIQVAFDDTVPFLRANLFITPKENGTRVKLKLHELSRVPDNAHLTLWAVSPDGQFRRIGTATGRGEPNVATIDTEENNVTTNNIMWPDFGIFVTTETTATAVAPTGPVIMRIVR